MTARRTPSTTGRRRTRGPAARRSGARRPATGRRTPANQVTGAFNRLVAERPVWAAIALVVLALAAWLYLRGTSDGSGSSAPPTSTAAEHSAQRSTTTPAGASDQANGLPRIAESALPAEAKEVLDAIRAGGPFEFKEDGAIFGNFERVLPSKKRGYYREYTVKLSTDRTRGAHRIVTGEKGEIYWTEDHYESFSVVEEGA